MKSFTYFLPAPPARKSGYQEKEFDHIFSHLMKNDYDIVDVKMQTLNTSQSAGVWILCLLGAKNQAALERQLQLEYRDIAEQVATNIKMDPSIEHDN